MASVAHSLDFPFSEADFNRVAAIAHDRIGLHLEAHKRDLVYGRLAKRLRKLGILGFDAYFALLSGPDGEAEEAELLSLLTTNVTHFFREEHHFLYMRDHVVPELITRAKTGQRVRIWSAGCSEGQEAYSLAMEVIAACSSVADLDLRILATDVDPKVLRTASQARYPKEQLISIPKRLQQIGTLVRPDGTFEIEPTIRRLVEFGRLNLIQPWPMRRSFDVIFCRNVAIYFNKQTQERLWKRFSDQLGTGGHLMVGHSERVSGPATEILESCGVTTYRKIGHPKHSARN